jgi:hypothetical protein
MRSYVPLAGAALLLTLAGPALAQPKDPAELFPAQTLAYFEMRQPDKLSRELAALIKGSALEDLAAVFAKARTDKGDTPDDGFYPGMMFSGLGMFFSPEALAEVGRMGGGAVAITGWSKDDGPEVVGVIYPGECNLIMMYLRTYLAADSEIRIADKVEGVNLYRARGRDYIFERPNAPGGAPPPPPQIKDKGPTFALMPGMVIIASTPKAAKEAVRRAKGKVAEPSLASIGAFKRAAPLREKPSVFAYADVGALTVQVDEAAQGKRHPDWDAFKSVINPRGMGTAIASVSLQNGNLDCRVQVQVDPKQPSPLFDLLPEKKAALDGLHFAPKDGLLTVTLPWTDGARRWEKVVALFDSVASASGAPAERLPSKEIADAEQKAGIKLGTDVFAKVAGFTLTVDVSGERAKGKNMPLQLAVNATDKDAAKALDEVIPKLLALGGGAVGAPATEKVDGITLRTYSGESVPWREVLYCGHEGKTVVLGPNKEGVAAGLTGGAKSGGLLGEPKVAAVLKDTGDAQVVGTWSIGETMLAMMQLVSSGPKLSTKPAGGPPPVPPKEPDKTPEAKFAKEMKQAVAPLAPAVLMLTRKGDLVVLEAKQTGLKTVSVRAINVLIDAAAHEMMAPRVSVNSSPPIPDVPVPEKP